MAKCKVKNCENSARSGGFCPMHYQRIKRLGSTDLEKKERKVCSVSGCGEFVHGLGLCQKHYKLEKYKKERESERRKKRKEAGSLVCSVHGCDGEVYLKGYCTKHYQRVRKFKATITDSCVYRELTIRDRFLLKTSMSDESGGCWEWGGYKNKYGYGILSSSGLPKQTHVISYEQFVGNIPEGLCVCHTCDNPGCVNPSHLFLATNEENSEDRNRKGRTLKGDKSPTAILTEKQVIRIKKMIEKGISNTHIGKKFGVTSWTISRIKCGKNWKHVVI